MMRSFLTTVSIFLFTTTAMAGQLIPFENPEGSVPHPSIEGHMFLAAETEGHGFSFPNNDPAYYGLPNIPMDWRPSGRGVPINPYTGVPLMSSEQWNGQFKRGISFQNRIIYGGSMLSQTRSMVELFKSMDMPANPTSRDFFRMANNGNMQVSDMTVEEHAKHLEDIYNHLKKNNIIKAKSGIGLDLNQVLQPGEAIEITYHTDAVIPGNSDYPSPKIGNDFTLAFFPRPEEDLRIYGGGSGSRLLKKYHDDNSTVIIRLNIEKPVELGTLLKDITAQGKLWKVTHVRMIKSRKDFWGNDGYDVYEGGIIFMLTSHGVEEKTINCLGYDSKTVGGVGIKCRSCGRAVKIPIPDSCNPTARASSARRASRRTSEPSPVEITRTNSAESPRSIQLTPGSVPRGATSANNISSGANEATSEPVADQAPSNATASPSNSTATRTSDTTPVRSNNSFPQIQNKTMNDNIVTTNVNDEVLTTANSEGAAVNGSVNHTSFSSNDFGENFLESSTKEANAKFGSYSYFDYYYKKARSKTPQQKKQIERAMVGAAVAHFGHFNLIPGPFFDRIYAIRDIGNEEAATETAPGRKFETLDAKPSGGSSQ